jgi:hypothetical protein
MCFLKILCTAAVASANEILTGGERKIETTLRTGARGGKTGKTITMATNGQDQRLYSNACVQHSRY